MVNLSKLVSRHNAFILMCLSSSFLFLLALILTLSPVVKYHSLSHPMRWNHWIGVATCYLVFWAQYFTLNKKNRYDPILLPMMMLIVGWGLITIFRLYPNFGYRQSIWLVFCLFLALTFIKHANKVREFVLTKIQLIYYLSLFSLLLTFVIGKYPGGNGPELWLGCCGIYLQPAEFYKISLLLFLSYHFSVVNNVTLANRHMKAIILIALSVGIFVLQKDFGSAVVISVFAVFFLYLTSEKKRALGFGGLILVFLALMGYFTIGLVKTRITDWLSPWGQTQSGSYQVVQSIIAMAAGGILGSGIGMGNPAIVPLSHSDFIFSAISEENGLVGSLALIIMFVFLIARAFQGAKNAENSFDRYSTGGIAILISVQTILIMGGNTRLLPITGLTLPFMSYGGSSLVVSFFSFLWLLLFSDGQKKYLPDKRRNFTINTLHLTFSSGFMLVALVCGWWSVIRPNQLLTRLDNPRSLLADSFVHRGIIFDRKGILLAVSIGEIGSLTRRYSYPSLSHVIGYDSIRYGRSGIELGLNEYLRGSKGYPAITQWFENLITNQPLKGLDIRLTIDSTIQNEIAEEMQKHKGGIAVINATSGDILALYSYPGYDANFLEMEHEKLKNDPVAPFLNRAIQSHYPAGKPIIPLLLLANSPDQMDSLISTEPDLFDDCVNQQELTETFSQLLRNGCEDALMFIIHGTKTENIDNLFRELSLPLQIEGLQTVPFTIPPLQNRTYYIEGNLQIRSNPLQIAYAYSVISNAGKLTKLRISDAIETPAGIWVAVNEVVSNRIMPEKKTAIFRETFSSADLPAWEVNYLTHDMNGSYSWYVAGLYNAYYLNPIVVSVAIESESLSISKQIGRSILFSFISKNGASDE